MSYELAGIVSYADGVTLQLFFFNLSQNNYIFFPDDRDCSKVRVAVELFEGS